jgi:uncharacterized protein (DUF2249 family)
MSVKTLELQKIDCRGGDRRAEVLAVFDSLAPGERLEVEADHAPRGLLAALQAQRPGRFEWSPLEEGPTRWCVELARRETPCGALRGVTEALAWDHDRLDALEREAFERRTRGDHVGASQAFAVFAHGLRRHIRFEEELLFPEFERHAGVDPLAGPTAVMRAEHCEIKALLEALERGIGDPGFAAETTRDWLHQVLGAHNTKEEQVLYPGTDRLLGEVEADALVRRIQAL